MDVSFKLLFVLITTFSDTGTSKFIFYDQLSCIKGWIQILVFNYPYSSVADPHGSETFAWNRIRNYGSRSSKKMKEQISENFISIFRPVNFGLDVFRTVGLY